MADKKIIAVLGSTGSQGGGLCRAILADSAGGFACRAVTRDTSKDKAKALASAGAQVVKADLDDVESLKKAFAGAYGVYAVTNFWEHFSGDKEKAQAKNVADAAKAAGVKHVIWSTLEDIRKFMKPDDKRMPMLQQKVSCAALRREGRGQRVLRGRADHVPRHVILLGQPLHVRPRPEEGSGRSARVDVPDGRPRRWRASRPRTSARSRTESSRAARSTSARPSASTARRSTIDQMGKTLSKVLGVGPVKYNAVEADVYRGFGFPGADEMGNMFQAYRDFEKEMLAARSADTARKLNPALQTFEQFVKNKKDAILPAMG